MATSSRNTISSTIGKEATIKFFDPDSETLVELTSVKIGQVVGVLVDYGQDLDESFSLFLSDCFLGPSREVGLIVNSKVPEALQEVVAVAGCVTVSYIIHSISN